MGKILQSEYDEDDDDEEYDDEEEVLSGNEEDRELDEDRSMIENEPDPDIRSSEEDSMSMESDVENPPLDDTLDLTSQLEQSQAKKDYNPSKFERSIDSQLARGIKRSRGGATIPNESSIHHANQPKERKESAIPRIVKDMATQLGIAMLEEPDDLIIQTEELISQLYLDGDDTDKEFKLETALMMVPEALRNLWQACCNRSTVASSDKERLVGIGPDTRAAPFHKANFLANFLLQLHHPSPVKGKQAFAASRLMRSENLSKSLQVSNAPSRPTAPPKVLFDWLEHYHNPYQEAGSVLKTYQPSPAAHLDFWDIIFFLTLRGRFTELISIFKRADFRHARTARDDGQDQDGYYGLQLGNIERVVNRAVQALESCPALLEDDWDIPGHDWLLFRKRVEHALEDLATFAEGRDRDSDPAGSVFEAQNFGLRSTTSALSQTARRAESRVPWTIYQNLKVMYGILLGGTTEIISTSQDWVEASIGLTAWWNGDDDDEICMGSLAMTRRSLRHSQSRIPRSLDANPNAAYLRRLAQAFEKVTDDSEFQINSGNAVEVGLASIFEGNVEGVLRLLRGWSLPIASAVVEIANLAGWFEPSIASRMVDGFSESDLMVLSYGQPNNMLTRDSVLVEYAGTLFGKEVLGDPESENKREGWELSIQIIARLDDDAMATNKVADLLTRIELSTDSRVDRLLDICNNFSMPREAQSIAEVLPFSLRYDTNHTDHGQRYADAIADSTTRYGTALFYYAQSHNRKKLRSVLDLLISYSLVHSTAYPALSSLEPNMKTLLNAPRGILQTLAATDQEAADTLHMYLTGYATLRKFYDLRDMEVRLQDSEKPTLRPIARKKAAAKALLAVIASAADNIHGGLYDESRDAVLKVDGLLVLLGEALVFVNRTLISVHIYSCICLHHILPRSVINAHKIPESPPLLNSRQIYNLLSAIEDLQTVNPSIYSQCEEVYSACIKFYNSPSTSPSQPPQALNKGISSLTASSSGGFSMIGSMMLESATSDGIRSASNDRHGMNGNDGISQDPKHVERGWDWRKGIRKDSKGSDVLRMLRVGLARELAMGWVDGAV